MAIWRVLANESQHCVNPGLLTVLPTHRCEFEFTNLPFIDEYNFAHSPINSLCLGHLGLFCGIFHPSYFPKSGGTMSS